jgi:hypothetical protein
MDRRFSNATSTLATAALKLCAVLANYCRTAIRNIVPSCTICAALAQGGARLRVCAKRDRRAGLASWPPGESWLRLASAAVQERRCSRKGF